MKISVIAANEHNFAPSIGETYYFQSTPSFINLGDSADLRIIHFMQCIKKMYEYFRQCQVPLSVEYYVDNLIASLNMIFPVVSAAWVLTLPPKIQLYFCLSRLCPHYLSHSPPNYSLVPWVEIFTNLAETKLPYLIYLVAITNIFLGNKIVINVENLEEKHKYKLLALQAYIKGDSSKALPAYEEALKLEKREVKKRNWFLTDFHAIFHLLLLMQTNKNLMLMLDDIAIVRCKINDPIGEFFILLELLISKVLHIDYGNEYLLEYVYEMKYIEKSCC